jgi:hypothetical protein
VTHTVVFRPQVAEETRAARQWYGEQQPGLGARFANAIDEVIRQIMPNPLAFPLAMVKPVARLSAGSLSRPIFECTLTMSSFWL